MKGQGGGGTAQGGGKVRTGGGNVTIKKSKSMQSKAIDNNVIKLRAALFDDQGKDKDVTGGIAKSFLLFERDGVCVDISFSAKLSSREVDWAFDLAKGNMEEIYDDSGYGWDDDDKQRELTEQGARFLLLKDRETQNLIGFVHFRFTVQGEVIDQMVGSPCIYVLDLQIEESFQKKGLGRHLLIIMELIARREQMTRISIPVFLQHPEMKQWLSTKCKGYTLDASYNEIGFDSDAEGFEVYSKVFTPPNPNPTRAAVSAPSPATSIINAPPVVASATDPGCTAMLPPTPPTDNQSSDVEEEVTVSVESVVAALKECYIQEHDGQEPDEQTVSQWTEEIRNLQTQGDQPDEAD